MLMKASCHRRLMARRSLQFKINFAGTATEASPTESAHTIVTTPSMPATGLKLPSFVRFVIIIWSNKYRYWSHSMEILIKKSLSMILWRESRSLLRLAAAPSHNSKKNLWNMDGLLSETMKLCGKMSGACRMARLWVSTGLISATTCLTQKETDTASI